MESRVKGVKGRSAGDVRFDLFIKEATRAERWIALKQEGDRAALPLHIGSKSV